VKKFSHYINCLCFLDLCSPLKNTKIECHPITPSAPEKTVASHPPHHRVTEFELLWIEARKNTQRVLAPKTSSKSIESANHPTCQLELSQSKFSKQSLESEKTVSAEPVVGQPPHQSIVLSQLSLHNIDSPHISKTSTRYNFLTAFVLSF